MGKVAMHIALKFCPELMMNGLLELQVSKKGQTRRHGAKVTDQP